MRLLSAVCLLTALSLSPQDYITKMDPASTLGLSTESVYGYSISHIKRVLDTEPPELPLCRRGMTSIVVTLKGRWAPLLPCPPSAPWWHGAAPSALPCPQA